MKKEFILLRLDEVKPYPNNPRLNDEAVIDTMESIKQCQNLDPIEVDENNIILSGHTRLKALQKLGYTETELIRYTGLTEEQKKKYRLLANKTGEKAEWNLDLLELELQDLDFGDFDFGFDFDNEEEPKEIVEDDVPDVPQEPKTKIGDLWKMGGHFLICGDSTDVAVIDRLMDGVKADMLFTSPPYSDMREYNGDKDLSVSNIAKFIGACKPYTDYQCVNLGIQRKNHEIVQYWDEYIAKAKECGYKLLAWNVWDKTMAGSIGQQSAFFPIRHEWIFVFGTEFFEINETWEKKDKSIDRKSNKRKVRQSDGTTKYSTIGDTTNKYKQMESVVAICSECGKIRALHPATFPVQLPAEYIKAMTDEGDSVIEPFGGSGSTLIACEQLNRKCYMAELDPKYVSVIVNRWLNFTGRKDEIFCIRYGQKLTYDEVFGE